MATKNNLQLLDAGQTIYLTEVGGGFVFSNDVAVFRCRNKKVYQRVLNKLAETKNWECKIVCDKNIKPECECETVSGCIRPVVV